MLGFYIVANGHNGENVRKLEKGGKSDNPTAKMNYKLT